MLQVNRKIRRRQLPQRQVRQGPGSPQGGACRNNGPFAHFWWTIISLGVEQETGRSEVVIILLFTIVTTIITYLASSKVESIVQRRSHDMFH